MTVEKFLQKWQVTLSSQATELLTLAITMLNESKDPAHDEHHVFALLENANSILERETQLVSQINFEVLILSVAWHDVWRASFVPRNALQLLYAFCWDGMGSKQLFTKHAKVAGLDDSVIKQVGYAIKKHHSVQFLPRKTLEAKILKDCDELELWSIKRAELMYEFALEYLTALGMKRLIRRYIKMKLKSSIKTVYFKTTAEILESRMQKFMAEFDEEINTF